MSLILSRLVVFLVNHYSYYVDDLRNKFTIRVEIDRTNLYHGYSNVIDAHLNMHKDLTLYLSTRLRDTEWEIQKNNGYHGFHYVWFTNKEDALAIASSLHITLSE